MSCFSLFQGPTTGILGRWHLYGSYLSQYKNTHLGQKIKKMQLFAEKSLRSYTGHTKIGKHSLSDITELNLIKFNQIQLKLI